MPDVTPAQRLSTLLNLPDACLPQPTAARLSALQALGILDTAPERAFDDLALIAKQSCEAPIALITLLDEKRQWFKAEIGLGTREMPIQQAVCAFAISGPQELFVVPDLSLDARFSDFSYVRSAPHLRFYAGAPIRTEDGIALGTICVLDDQPRPEGLTAEQRSTLVALARIAADQLSTRLMNARLKKGERRYRALVDTSADIVWRADDVGSLQEGTVDRFTGTVNGMLGDGWIKLVHPEDQYEACQAFQHSIQAGIGYHNCFRLRSASGEYRWVEERGVPVRDENEKIVEWIGTSIDIHERREAELALRRSEARYRALAAASSAVVWCASPDGEIVDGWFWEEFSGQSREKGLGGDWIDRIHPEDQEGLLELWAHNVATGSHHTAEFRVQDTRGEFRWVQARAVPIRDREGTILEWIGALTDIHERRLAELALQESEDHYRHSVELNPQIPWTADSNGNILEVGPVWLELTGLSREQALGQGWSSALHPDDYSPTFALWGSSLATGKPFDAEYRLRLCNGGFRWMRARASARFLNGTPFRWYGTVEDIHTHKAALKALERSEQFAQSILSSASHAIEVLSADGRLEYINPAGVLLFEDVDKSALTGARYVDFYPEDNKPLFRAALHAAKAGHWTRYTVQFPTHSGTFRWWDVSVGPIGNESGGVDKILVTSADITEAKRAEEETVEANERLSALLETTMDCVVALDGDWRISYMNCRAARYLPNGRELLGQDLRSRLQTSELISAVAEAYERRSTKEIETFVVSLNRWLQVQATGSEQGVTIFFRDITEQKAARDRIEYQAHYDALTALPNRFSFRQELRALLEVKGAAVALLLLDLDDFKSVNDSYGHPVGDELLVQVAARLRKAAAGEARLARLGGDEFALIANDSANPQVLAAKLLAAVHQPFTIAGRTIRTGVSIGIAISPQHGTGPDELFANADIALYETKRAGISAIRQFEPEQQARIKLRESLKQDLAHALELGQLYLAFQPQVDIRSGALVGFEALLRWDHPERGPIPPSQFIPIAEETGLIHDLGAWVIEEACRQATNWPSDIAVSVNLSPVQFRDVALPLKISSLIIASGLSARRLTLEITESVLLDDTQDNLQILLSLRSLGVRISLDDFGTGYSSFAYLKRFPFDELKIDRSFTAEVVNNAESASIVKAVLGLAADLGVAVTAEGVEHESQRAWLASHGAAYAQGFLFSKPLGNEKVTMMLREITRKRA